jgi:hypothetical protein
MTKEFFLIFAISMFSLALVLGFDIAIGNNAKRRKR